MLELFRKLKVNQFSKARTLLFSLLQMNYKERNLALLVLKDSEEFQNYFQVAKTCKSYLQVSPRLSFLPEWLSFLSECYEPMVELWKCHLSPPSNSMVLNMAAYTTQEEKMSSIGPGHSLSDPKSLLPIFINIIQQP